MNQQLLKRYVLIFALAGTAFAQSEIGSASLSGTITDASGGAVPATKVSARNAATGLVRNTQTSDLGLYTFAGTGRVLPRPAPPRLPSAIPT